jgi:hypothetical protein
LSIVEKANLSSGILQDTAGRDNWNPWSSKNLRKTKSFIDYYTIIFQTTTSNYSVSHGLEITPLPAICRYGKGPFKKYVTLFWLFSAPPPM